MYELSATLQKPKDDTKILLCNMPSTMSHDSCRLPGSISLSDVITVTDAIIITDRLASTAYNRIIAHLYVFPISAANTRQSVYKTHHRHHQD